MRASFYSGSLIIKVSASSRVGWHQDWICRSHRGSGIPAAIAWSFDKLGDGCKQSRANVDRDATPTVFYRYYCVEEVKLTLTP